MPYKVGLENMKAEAWEEAVKSFQTAIEIDPTFEMAHYMLGRTHMAQKKFAEASVAYEKCRDAVPEAERPPVRQRAGASAEPRHPSARDRRSDPVVPEARNQTPQVIRTRSGSC